MVLEIERRFLVSSDDWRQCAGRPQALKQCYLFVSAEGMSLRVRIVDDNLCWLTLKSPASSISRHEFEYLIPSSDAQQLWHLSKHRLSKIRYPIDLDGGQWVVDCFQGPNDPLVIAEVELPAEDFPCSVPGWCGNEITENLDLTNASLAKKPFSDWTSKQRKNCFSP